MPDDNAVSEAATTEETAASEATAPETTETVGDKAEPVDAGTVVADAGKDEKAEPKGYWPEDWRQRLAGQDEALQKRLSRFQSPEGVLKSWRALEQRMSSGELKAALPENASDEQLAAWRQENGLPEKPEGYLEGLPDGLVVGDEDKPIVDQFVARMHEANAPPEAVKQALSWALGDLREQQIADRTEKDNATWAETEDVLRTEWGGEYRQNQTAIKNWLGSLPDGLGEQLAGARLADGSKMLGSAPALKWLMGVISETNPGYTVVNASGGGSIESVEEEISSIRATMGDPSSPYHRDGGKTQARYQKLLQARERMAARAA